MQPTFHRMKDKGGRPPHAKIRIALPLVLQELRLANAAMLRRKLEHDLKVRVSLNTVKKALSELEEDGKVQRKKVSSRIITYSLS